MILKPLAAIPKAILAIVWAWFDAVEDMADKANGQGFGRILGLDLSVELIIGHLVR